MKKVLSIVLALALLLGMASFASADELTELNTYETQARELETWNVHYSQAAADLNVLCNLFDGLLTNDNHGNLKANAAKSYETPDNGKTWIFTLNEGMKWINKEGEEQADVKASDWATGLEWVLNYSKNDSYNVSMPAEMIAGANDYYEYTKAMAESEGADAVKALDAGEGSKFAETVGIAVDDAAGTITYTLVDTLPYFPSVATYNCLYPLSAELIEEVGVDGYRDITWEDMWYSGAYVVTYYEFQNQKVLEKAPNYWNDANCKRFDKVTIKMVESPATAYQLFKEGQLDHVTPLDTATLQDIYNEKADAEYKANLVESRPTKYSYQMHLVYAKNLEDGETPDVNWNTAVANENFRKSWYYGLDLTGYFARTNAINPLSCQNFCYTGNGVAFTSNGTDYTQLVRDELGLQYSTENYARLNKELAAECKAKAMEELTAKGVTFPVEVDYYISGASTTAAETAKVLENIFSECLGDDYVKLVTKTYTSLAPEVRTPRKASFYINGWGADFADPINFLGQETYNDPQAYYSNAYSHCNENDDPDLVAAYQEFTGLVTEAKTITGDLDARYAAFAKAEACFLNHALVIPCSYEVGWELTKINNYTKVYSMYGMQAYRYVDWETSTEAYTTEQMAANAEAYAAQ